MYIMHSYAKIHAPPHIYIVTWHATERGKGKINFPTLCV